MAITQTISAIPQAGHRGVDARDTFVTKQEAFQDALTGTFVTEINAFKTQANTLETNVNTKEATVVAKEALMNPHYTAIDSIVSNISNINTVVNNIVDIQNAEENATLAINAKNDAISAKNDAISAKNDAELAYENTVQTANVSKWVSGTSYLEGNNVWSPINFLTYRAKANTSGTTDPSLDTTNWAIMANILGINSETIAISSNYQITRDNEIAINFTPSSNLIVTLPNATTITDSVVKYLYNNSSTYYIQVNDFGGTYKFTISPNTQAIITCVDTSTSNGVWVEQNIVQFNPIFDFPASDIASALDSTDYCDIAKTSIESSNYYTLFYRNTSNNLVIQSVTIINGVIAYGNSATIASGVANVPSNIVALNPSTNTGIVVYQNSTTLYVRTFTNVNGTLTLGTAYSLAGYYAPVQNGYKTTWDTTAEAISTTELLLNTQATSATYATQTIFTTTNNTFFSGGISFNNYLVTVVKSDLTPGKYYGMAYDNSGNLTTYKRAYTVTSSAISATLYSTTDYGFAYASNSITAIEIGYDILLVAYKSGLSATSTTIKVVNWAADTNHYPNSMVSVNMIDSRMSLRKVGTNLYMLIGTSSSDNIIRSFLIRVDDSYRTTVIGSSSSGVRTTANSAPSVCKYVPITGDVIITYPDGSRANQQTTLKIKSR